MSKPMKRSIRVLVWCGCALGAILPSGAALAQAVETQAEDEAGLQVIVVTAQKVAENVQDVPIAVSVINSDRLEATGTVGLDTLSRIVPSVTFRRGTTTSASTILMRGVGTISFSIAAEPSVSTVVDGVVLSRSGQAFLDLVDIERMEVLRGPQGTLFGKNASAGLVNIVSRGGSDSFEAEVRADYYDRSEFRLRGSLAGPLAENLSARVTGFYSGYDGLIYNVNPGQEGYVNGYEHYGARGIIDYNSGSSDLRFIVDYMEANDDCCADVTAVSRGGVVDAELGLPGGAAQGEDQRYINHNLISQTYDQQWSATLSGNFDVLSSHVLSFVAGYRDWQSQQLREGDFLPRALVGFAQLHDNGTDRTKQYSLEVRLASDQSQPFFYQVGAFAWHSDNQQQFLREDISCSTSTLPVDPITGGQPCNLSDLVNTTFPRSNSDSDVNSSNYAMFGQATYRINDLIALVGGLRYTWDRLDYVHTRAPGVNATTGLPLTGPGISGSPAGGTLASGGNGTNTSSGSANNGNLSGRAVVQITPADDLMLYGSYTRGYKGPAFNVFFNHTAPTNAIPIDEETSNAFELGFKSQFADNRVQLNAAAFSVEYDGFQANNFVNLNGAVVTNLTNAGTVKTKGFEIDLLAVPIDELNLRANVAYADARVKEFNPNPSTNAPDARNGTVLPLAPEFTYMLGADYTADIGKALLYVNTDYRHSSSQFSDLGEQGPIDPYGVWNASIGISDPEDRYRLTFHINNILDDSYVLLNVSNGQRLQLPRDADRYVGVSLRAKLF